MNDDFLNQFRQSPRPAFANELYERISQPQPGMADGMAEKLTLRNALMALAALVLVVACVRAATAPRWVEVGIIWVEVKPYTLITEYPRFEPVNPAQYTLPEYTLADVTETFGGAVKIPTWLPEGYECDAVSLLGNWETEKWAFIGWRGTSVSGYIQLIANSTRWWNTQKYVVGPTYTYQPVAPGSYREVQVNGQPAVLVRGDWDWVHWSEADFLQQDLPIKVSWDKKASIQLYWLDGEWLYRLIASPDISSKDLIRIAESLR
jgi:hypothetical protein